MPGSPARDRAKRVERRGVAGELGEVIGALREFDKKQRLGQAPS